jgi:hypothetical protein
MQAKLIVSFLLLAHGSFAVLQRTIRSTDPRIAPQTITAEPTRIHARTDRAEYYTSTNLITIAGETNAAVTRAGNTITIAIPTCRSTIIPDPNGYVPPGTCGSLWNYYPSFGAAATFTGIFMIIMAVHGWQIVVYRKVCEHHLVYSFTINTVWAAHVNCSRDLQGWCWVIITACAWETIAMLFRTVSTKYQQSSSMVLVFQIFILTAPLCESIPVPYLAYTGATTHSLTADIGGARLR